MKLGFISDTHGGYENTIRALEGLKGSDQICHLGDVLYHGPRNDIPARIQKAKELGGIIVLNPGSTTIPKDGTSSFAFYENGKIELWDLESQSVIKVLPL